jgi:ABC-type nitrate/sulfonate/bicarbonate transport system substrate-binding protein
VQRFVRAYLLAFRDVVASPQEAVDIVIAANPEYKSQRAVLLAQLQADIKGTFFSADTKSQGLGTITAARWSETIHMLQSEGQLPKSAAPKGGFDNRFVAASYPMGR